MHMIAPAIAAGCITAWATPAVADDYAKFYQAAPAGSVALLPSTAPPELLPSTGDLDADRLRLWQQGYGMVGASSFNGTVRDPAKALKFARQIRARYVIVASGDVAETQAEIPFTMPTVTQSTTNGNVEMHGPGGQVGGTFGARTTTTGTQTTGIPFTVRRADQVAAFFCAVERKGSGVFGRPLDDAERITLGTNRGLKVLSVRDGSPAYDADIVPGDIITTVNGQPFALDAWNAAMRRPPGESTSIGISRGGAIRTVSVKIPGGWN
jgi:PDZ domain